MNKLVKRGLSAYMIFMKNKIATSIMMLVSGFMMFIAALNGKGNDTKTLPIAITSVGLILAFWGIYRIGYIKSHFDTMEKGEQRSLEGKVLILQIVETLVYLVIAGIGVFLLVNENFINKILNLMAGGFTVLNGILGIINAYKRRENIDFQWKLMVVLTVLELAIGAYFIISSDSISIGWYVVMGVLTTVAGLIEVISALTRENLRNTLDDSKKIVKIIKNDES